MKESTIVVTYYSKLSREAERVLDWPAVPRVGDTVEMEVNGESAFPPVREVIYCLDGRILVRAGDYAEGSFSGGR